MSFQHGEAAFGKFQASRLIAQERRDPRRIRAAFHIGRYHKPSLAIFAQNLIGPVRFLDLGGVPGWYPSRRCFDEQIAKSLCVSQIVREPHDNVETAITVGNPADDPAACQPA
jgi:hypothetical protein